MTDWKARCAALIDKIDYTWGDIPDDVLALIDRTRAELAQTELKSPTDEDLISPTRWMIDDCVYDNDKGEIAQSLRELIARWGHPAIQSEEGWYPSFADWLEGEMPEGTVIGDPLWWASKIATYLQRHAIQPVPTPEPGTADHITDDEGTRWDRTMDAALWAKAFCLICPEMTSREGLMIGWFANAIMAGCDHQAWKMDAEREPVPVGERLPGLEDCDTRGRCWFIDDDEKWCPVILGDILDEDEPDAIQRVICYYGYTHWLQGWALPVPTSQESP